MIFGTRVVIEAIMAGKEIEKVLIQKDASNKLNNELFLRMKEHSVPFVKVPAEKLQKITRKNHQGVIAFLSPIQYASLEHVIDKSYAEGKDPLLVILDRITDVRNFGAIARTLDCVGADALVFQNRGNAMIGGDAMKTSAGALNYLPVCRVHNLKETITYLRDSGIRIIAGTEKTDQTLYDTDLSGPCALILGSEEDGISPEYLKLCDQRVKIPMSGNISSLNVSVSAGIILYEIFRQRIKK